MSAMTIPAKTNAPLSLSALRSAYASAERSPEDVVAEVYQAISASTQTQAWLHVRPQEELLREARALAQREPASLPLFGIPFAVKDNIDVAGLPTSAACPAFSYVAQESAAVVTRLQAAGALLIGKTNLDQFATGLVGTRSPYGTPHSVFSADHVSGGSSSGSAVVVAAQCVSFSLGTDTAGSGRVPAAFNNIVGAKPTRGWLSTPAVVPACRSLDCVSVFAHSCDEAWEVLRIAGGQVDADPWSRPPRPQGLPGKLRFAVLAPAQRQFFGDELAAQAYADRIEKLASVGQIVDFDFTPFAAAAALLYDGPWVAERLEAAGALLESQPEALDPAVKTVIARGLQYSALDAWTARSTLASLQVQASRLWQTADVLVLPTAPCHPRIDEVLASPLEINSRLGIYTNFANLLDLCALALPAGLRPDGLPFGLSLFAPAWHDAALARHGQALQTLLDETRNLGQPISDFQWPAQDDAIRLAVVGAHLSGMPLNRELVERAARFVCATQTAPEYTLYALPGTVPAKPGLIRTEGQGTAIAVEVWELSPAAFGDFVARIPAPLGIGSLQLADGSSVKGFICEAHAVRHALDISNFGGWRNYIASLQ